MRRTVQTDNSEKTIQKIFGMLGLAEKAGKVSAGELRSEKSIGSGKARLCIIACDASANTRKHFSDMCLYRNIPVEENLTDMKTLGHVIGKKDRSVITIDDDGFSKAVLKLIAGGRAYGK